MERFIGRFSNQIYALMRIVVGLALACHGVQKLFGALGGFGGESGATAPLFSLMFFAGVIEFFGGLLVAIGLFATYAAFICSGLMAAAYFMAHAPQGFWPVLNKGELAMLYSFVFLYIASRGVGTWSLSQVLAGGRD